jgi:Asp-tRNA(Asn)/Glu-tRNA(Gln) amidotransferase A subunit family amidase
MVTIMKGKLKMHLRSIVLIFSMIIVFVACKDESEIKISTNDIASAEKIIGLSFTANERDSLKKDLDEFLQAYAKIREVSLSNDTPPSLQFNPVPVGYAYPEKRGDFAISLPKKIDLPEDMDELAFYSVRDLAHLIYTRKITSLELTEYFIDRLEKYDSQLHCVITITEDSALAQARAVDAEIAAGKYRGYLHGIPYGAKDLLAKKGYKTTWGAMPYKDQIIKKDATIIKKLKKAGAVLVAKLSMGALAWGDVWYGEKTRNPWNPEQGSSGSSAGSASATAAGLVPFAIGTETWGSIVSPSNRCGTTGLRPSYGRISRYGAMALSWSMDKIGSICRTVEDCAIVFQYIYGPDELDQSIIDLPFNYQPDIDIKKLRIGYLKSLFDEDYENKANDQKTLGAIRKLDVELIPIDLPELPVNSLSFILSAEAAAAFDELTRSNKDDLMVRQIRNAWPNVFRSARFIPAVEYIQANRLRYLLIQAMDEIMQKVDLYIAPSFEGDNLLLTNLTGHPCIVLPNGFNSQGSPTSITFIARLFDEGRLLAFTRIYQEATEHHTKHPPMFSSNN